MSVDAAGIEANAASEQVAVSNDGRFVAFSSSASNLVAGDTNGVEDVFVRDLVAGTTVRASVAADGNQAGAACIDPSISGDGRFVAFTSSSTNLVPSDTNAVGDVFVRDLVAGTTVRASLSLTGAQGNGASSAPAISGDGRYVAFSSSASNLVSSDTNGVEDAFVRENPQPTVDAVFPSTLLTGATTAITVGGSGFFDGAVLIASQNGGGITFADTTVVSPTVITANATVAPDATSGPRHVWVQNPGTGPGAGASGYDVCVDCIAVTDAMPQMNQAVVQPGYEGTAYLVPTDPSSGPDPNSMTLPLRDDAGQPVGVADVEAGTEYYLSAPISDPGIVEIPWGDDTTAVGSREDFWLVPNFVELGRVEVTIGGTTMPLVDSGMLYHLGHSHPTDTFDDPATPHYDGIAFPIRLFLECNPAVGDSWSIANQKFAVDRIEDGVYADDPTRIAHGVAGVDWGLAQSFDDEGVFSLYRDCDDSTVRDYGEQHHTSQWLAEVGRAVYLLASSRYAGEYRDKIDTYIEHVEQLASRLTEDDNYVHWWNHWLHDGNGDMFGSKTYLMAHGLFLAASLTDNPADAADWAAKAEELTELGMSVQWPNGVDPQRGGYDVRYQMAGTWYKEIIYSVLEGGSLRDDLRENINRAILWMDGRVDDTTGQVDLTGCTRTCNPADGNAPYHPYYTELVYLLWGETQPGWGWLIPRAVLIDQGHQIYGNPCP